MANLHSRIVERESLSPPDIRAMYELYRQYYGASSYALFNADIGEKDQSILLHDHEQRLVGFSTLMLIEFEFESMSRRAIFSGDTIIHHDYWGTQALSLAWCRQAGVIKRQHPDIPLYWFLIVKGYRTYRYLPLFARTFYPTWRYDTPRDINVMMALLAENKFGDAYRPESGLIRFEQSKGHLKEGWADIPDHVINHRDVKYFLERNPGYYNGDELVCFTELSEANLRSHALRAFSEAVPS